jgi:hypothetical protein
LKLVMPTFRDGARASRSSRLDSNLGCLQIPNRGHGSYSRLRSRFTSLVDWIISQYYSGNACSVAALAFGRQAMAVRLQTAGETPISIRNVCRYRRQGSEPETTPQIWARQFQRLSLTARVRHISAHPRALSSHGGDISLGSQQPNKPTSI